MDTVEEVKRRIDLVEYIGRVTRLQKSGRNFRGLCPFHTEKTPSFYVFPDRASWRCFGSCGEGGDLLSFVQKRENLEFRAALHQLAAEAGVEITPESTARRSRGEHLSAILSAAVDFYQRCFREPRGEAARAYIFEKRGLKPDAVETFRIGWAPDEWRLLRDYLTGRGYDERDCVAAGLLVESEHGGQPYDRFRGRVIIPIADERGQYVAMGGRGLQGEEPKYLNSPQTEIFDKGRTLFGLHLAAAAIRQARTVVVVEGYMDVIGPYQAGFQNVVATMGTSLTEDHVVLLKRFARRVVLAMDPDAAGLAAAERAGGLLLGFDSPEGAARAIRSAEALTAGAEIELAVAPLPPGKDPDEVARESPESWANAIANAAPFAEFLINRLMGDTQVNSPVDARRVVDRLRPVLLGVRDPLERGMYVQRIARRLGVAEAAVLERIRQPVAGGRPRPALEARQPLSPEEVLLALLLRHPELRHGFRDLPASLFTGGLDRELFARWAKAETLGGADDPVAMHARELESRRLPPLSGEEAATAARAKIREITRERVIQHQVAISEQVAEAEKEFGAGRVAAIGDATWRGVLPLEGDRAVAETVIEDLQLGLSIHRREEPRVRP